MFRMAISSLASATFAAAAFAGAPADRKIDVSDQPNASVAYSRIVAAAKDMCRESDAVRTAAALRQCVRVVVARTVSAHGDRQLLAYAQAQPTAAKAHLTALTAD